MNNKLRSRINELTADIIKEYNISTPIKNIDEVVEKLGGRVEYVPRDELDSDGKLLKSFCDVAFIIKVRENQVTSRINFTIAHELGHLFLHMGYQINESLWNDSTIIEYNRRGNSEKELQANEFAASLLMPKAEYIKIVNENSIGNFVNIGKVADYFGVSVDAASYRGKWLGYLQW